MAGAHETDNGAPPSESVDLVAENIQRLAAIFPEAFTDDGVDFDALRQLLGDEVGDADEKYGLNWHGKRRARQLALTPSAGTLRPAPQESEDWGTTQNLMIEGDNLEVLKLLQKSYAGKVKLIYIDPPYNTGKDFVYPDDFRNSIKNYLELTGQVDSEGRKMSSNAESSGRFHTDWLNMMYPRLTLARGLLSNTGVICISIDDHEVQNLRAMCDEILGEENFIASMIWEKGRKNDAKLISIGHEYLVVYARSLTDLRAGGRLWREEKPGARELWDAYVTFREDHGDDDRAVEEALGGWFSSLPKGHPARKWTRYKRVDSNGPWRDDNISWPGGGGPRYDVIHPATERACKVPERGWIYASLETMQRHIAAGVVEFRDDHTEPPFRKSHIRPIAVEAPSNEELASDLDEDEELAVQVRGSYFYKQAQVAVKALRRLMDGKVFDNPKDHEVLGRLFDYVTGNDPDALILDFFAGSGTTGHAVMAQNAADGGSRRYILVQLPEPLDRDNKDQKVAAEYCDDLGMPRNIAELTKERLRRAARKVQEDNPDFEADLGFRVFKLDSSNIRAWDPDPDDLEGTLEDSVEHIKADRSEQDVLYELLLKLGLDLTVPIESRQIVDHKVHAIGGGTLFACLAEAIASDDVEALAEGIVNWHATLEPAGDSTCVFRDSAFADDVAKTNLTAILQQHGLENVRSL